jgi:hypothetical protein
MIDELASDDVKRLAVSLEKKGLLGSMEGLFWIHVPEELLDAEQLEHLPRCGPYGMAVEVGGDWVRMELLVRARNQLRCSCIRYASAEQRAFAIDFLDNALKQLDIPV